jgi:hypothetical protein
LQIHETEQPFIAHIRGVPTTAASAPRHLAPHHPLLSGLDSCDYPRSHRHHHHRHSTLGASGLHQPHHSSPRGFGPPTFGGSGPDIMPTGGHEDSNQWTKIDLGPVGFGHGGSKSAPVTSGNSPTQSLSVRSPMTDQMRLSAKYEKIDRIATWLFPIIFFLFNVCYWSYYLLLSDALAEIW